MPSASPSAVQIHLPRMDQALRAAIQRLDTMNFATRLAARDQTLFGGDTTRQASVASRLGWLDSHRLDDAGIKPVEELCAGVRAAGFTRAVLLGMGGSSLAPEVFAESFGRQRGGIELTVLDNTDPEAVARISDSLDWSRTLFLVSSKSGTTTETLSFFHHFHERLQQARVARPGDHFVAITDPGTPLADLAREQGFRHCFINPVDVGGRYSALSYFGLVPAALLGLDVSRLLKAAATLERRSRNEATRNPGLYLGAILGACAAAGRNKLTLSLSPSIAGFGAWTEQLVAESTGKDGQGIIPVDGEASLPGYGPDRVFVVMNVAGEKAPIGPQQIRKLVAAGHPVVAWALKDRYQLGAEFLRWELATAAAGALLGINPFDEPNVTEAKDSTRALLDSLQRDGGFPKDSPCCTTGNLALYRGDSAATSADAVLKEFLRSIAAKDYLGLLAYLTSDRETDAALDRLRGLLGKRLGRATTLGYGPRYLHSTGQLHKGGTPCGRFILITADHTRDLPVPGARYSFGQLQRAQALGDFHVLQRHQRPVLRVHLSGDPVKAIKELTRHVEAALPPARG